MGRHPETRTLVRFVRGEATSAEGRTVVRHLVSGCSRCLRRTRAVWALGGGRRLVGGRRPGDPVLHPASYAGLWERADRVRRRALRVREADQRLAQELFRELQALPSSERMPRVCGERRFGSLALCRILVAASDDADGDPAGIEETAELAVAVAEKLDPGTFGHGVVHDARGRAWAALAAARRGTGDERGCERALTVAEAQLRRGSGDPLERARLLLLRATRCRDRGQFPQALEALKRARRLHRELGDDHFLGLVLVEEGRVLCRSGDQHAAVSSLREALGRLDPERGPRLLLRVATELGHLLVETGRVEEAEKTLRRAWALGERDGDRRQRLRLVRLAGRVALARGRQREAEAALEQACANSVACGLGDEAALAICDLAGLYLQTGDLDRLRRLGEASERVVGVSDLGLDGRVVLQLLRLTVAGERISSGLITQLAAHLARARPAA